MSTLIIRHIQDSKDSDPPQFQVRGPDGQRTPPAPVTPAIGYPVEGRPNSELMAELRWYLEKFLEYPFDPETDHADRVLQALRGWAEAAFDVLFGNGDGARLFEGAMEDGEDQLRLQIESDDPRVLSWPWETLHRPGAGPLGQLCQIERRVRGLEKLPPFTAELPRDRVNILMVTARPYDKEDVAYRSVSRPLIDLVETEKLPVDVHILRPPTFERLREHLKERPHHYHILHFDGHGEYRQTESSGKSRHEGRLIFEDEIGADDPISARKLNSLLRKHEVPVVILNACQSGMLDGHAETAFASLAASLLKAGTRSVVAMAYSLYVSAAQEFLPVFYRGLFKSGDVAEGVRVGRVRLAEERGRVCVRGRFDLEDWLVPVLYQQENVDLSFAAEAREVVRTSESAVVGLDNKSRLGAFVGRDSAILQLERATRLAPAAILINGLGGVGKTTLALGFVEWLGKTEGLKMDCFWHSFQEIRSAEYVWNRMGEHLFDSQFPVLDPEKKILRLAQVFREHRSLIIWDNFEVVAGIVGASMHPTLSDEDRGQLRMFLAALRGGQTKILITSRNEESWLGLERQIVRLSGLRGEERWIYCEEIVKDLDVDIDRGDRNLVDLMDLLDGHPLSMRVILSELGKRSAKGLIAALQSNLAELDGNVDGAVARLYATLGFATEGLGERLRPLLVPLAFHVRFVDGKILEVIAQKFEPAPSRAEIDTFLCTLTSAGLLRELGLSIFEMHPALTGFLRSTVLQWTAAEIRKRWARAFVDFFGRMSDLLVLRPFHEHRANAYLYVPNFLAAVELAEQLDMAKPRSALLNALAVFAENQHRFAEAQEYYQRYICISRERGEMRLEAAAYHHLGMIAEQLRDLVAAENWCLKSLKIKEMLGDEQTAANTYHQLGRIAEERRDFEAAVNWHHKSLRIRKKLGDEHNSAKSYHHLGTIALERRDFDIAEDWYLKSLKIIEKLDDEHSAGITYYQLGRLAEERCVFDVAESWYLKSLKVNNKIADKNFIAMTYHQLGVIALRRHSFDVAEDWYLKSLEIKEMLNDEYGAALTYHQLGRVALERSDFGAAENWWQKSLGIFKNLGDEHGVARIYYDQGKVALVRSDFDTAEEMYQKSFKIQEDLGDEHSVANTCEQLGMIAGIQSRFEDLSKWLLKSIDAFANANDQQNAQRNAANFMGFYKYAPVVDQAKMRSLWESAGLPWPEDESGAES